jgi:prepilin-type N-terminal cleavage/methylation domain-containing protein
MMRTLAIFPAADRSTGFTLLELLVVLAILGLVAGLVAPALVRSVESWRAQSEVDRVTDQIRALPARARARGRPLLIDDDVLASPDGPVSAADGWMVTTPDPWTVRANGYCEGGILVLARAGRDWRLRAIPPFCDVERVTE